MHQPLIINAQISIPAEEIRFTFARSSGPGGQNVNKVNTKARLRWSPTGSAALPPAVKQRFCSRYANQITEEGELTLASDRYREQSRNVRDCLNKLRDMVLTVVTPPTRRKPTRPSRRAVESRLAAKKRLAKKKQNRRPPPTD